MKNLKLIISTLFLFGSFFNGYSTIILTENFSGGPAGYTTGSHTFTSGNTWDLTSIQGGTDVRFLTNVSASIISPSVNSVGTITFKTKEAASGGGTFVVSKSINGGAFTIIDSHIFAGTAFSSYSVTINDVSNNIRIKVSTNAGSSLIVDDFQITDYVIGSALTVSTPALSGFVYIVGFGPSTSTYYNLSGSLLNGAPGNITVTAPTNYEISLNDYSFSPSVNVGYTSSTLASTTVYVRLKAGLPIGSYNSANITNVGGGAPTTTVTLSGAVAAVPPPIIEVNPSVLSGFSYSLGSGPSTSQSYNLYGNYLTGYPSNLTLTAPAKYEISRDNSTFSSSLLVAYTAPLLNGTPIYVRLKAGLAVGTHNSQNITHSGGGALAKSVTCNGNVTAAPVINLTVSPGTLSGFTYINGSGPSTSKTYNLSGSNLTGFPSNITITAPSNYEVSRDNSTFTPSVSVAYSSATLSATPIYVRLKAGLAVGNYNSELVANAGGGASTANVTCNGSVTEIPTPTLKTIPSLLYGFTYLVGSGPSVVQNYNLSGINLTGFPSNITVTAPTNYEVSLTSGGTYSSTLSVPYSSATLASTPIYVRLKSGLAIGTYNSEIITNTGGGATAVNVTCNGNVTAAPSPLLSLSSSTLSGFNYVIGNGPSASQSYNLSGSSLTGFPSNITVTAPTNYEISLSSGSGYATSLNVPYSSATLASTPIYVRLKAGLGIASYNSEIITNSGGGATTVNVTCNGTVTTVPPASLALSATTLTGFAYTVGNGPSTAQSYNLSGANLTGFPSNITLTAPTNYEISLSSGSGYISSLNVPYSSATLASTPIYVRLKTELAIGTYNSEIIANVGGGATAINVICSGSVTDIVTGPCFSENFSGFTDGTHASPASSDISSTINSFTQTTGWLGVKVFSAGGEIKLGSTSASGSVTTPTIDLSAGGTLSFDIQKFGTDAGLIQVFHAPNGVTFTQMGTDITPTENYTTQTVPIIGGTAFSKIRIGTTQKRVYLDNISVDCGNSTPTPVLTATPNSLSGFTYMIGAGPSISQSYNLSGINLTGFPSDILVTAPANYEVSLNSTSGFTPSINVNYTSATLANTPIYVRLKSGLAVGNYNSENITNTVAGATTVDVVCNGNVTATPIPVLTATPNSLSGFTYILGAGPSVSQSYNLSGANLTGFPSDIMVTAPANYEVSLNSTSGFAPSINVNYTSATLANTPIYVRLKSGLAVGNYNSQNITNTVAGATTVNVICNGNVTAAPIPVLTATPNSLSGFTYILGAGPSISQSYNLSGINLTGVPSDIMVTAPANYEVSLNSTSGFATSINVNYASATLANTPIYVRLKSGLAVGNYNSQNITNTVAGATTVNVICNGNVTAAPIPVLTATPNSLSGFTYILGAGPSISQSYNLGGINLTGFPSNILVTAPANYEVSLNSTSGFTPSINVNYTSATLANTPIYVRLKSGLAVGNYNTQNVTNTVSGATTVNVVCNGNVTAAPIPVLTATPTSLSGFTYILGAGPSASQSYNLSGVNLIGFPSDILVNAPANYEVSLNSTSGFATSINVNYTSATLANTPIYVRLKSGLAVGNYNTQNVTNTVSGATTVDVVCNGTVTTDVSVNDYTNMITISAYPNPFNDQLTLKISGADEIYQVSLLDASGKVVLETQTVTTGVYELNTSNIAPGIYVLKVKSKGNCEVIKVVKNR